jgi:parallel beta-helix repeat protein
MLEEPAHARADDLGAARETNPVESMRSTNSTVASFRSTLPSGETRADRASFRVSHAARSSQRSGPGPCTTKEGRVPRIILLAALVVIVAIAAAGQAAAGPSPTDSDPIASEESIGQIHLTLPFALGEVDLSTLGVSDAELVSVGPTVSPTAASGDVLIVDDDALDCPNAQFMTIQSAVTAATAGDKIKVCRGTYIEQVTIPAGKDNLTLFSEGARQAIIKAPLVMAPPQAIVRVNDAQDVTIRHFTITGPGGGPCNSIRYGVFVDGGGSALITDNHITEIRDFPPLSGCQNGIGVSAGRVVVPDGPTFGSATIVHNLIDKYQKGGVLVDGSGSSGEVAFNEVIGFGPTVNNAQNGIQVSRQAHVDVHHNKVSQNFYSPPGVEATGILLFDNPDSRVHHNSVFLNESGIGSSVVNGTAEISYNSARNNFDGIVAYSSTMNTLITHNKAFENTRYDCRDDTIPTDNFWVKDLGRTENQPGLCKQAGP